MANPVPDFGKAAADYAQYRLGFCLEFYRRIAALGVGLKGQRVCDLGTGTGALARDLARQGCTVHGVDISAPMLVEARKLSTGLPIRYSEGSAAATGLQPASFECVTAAQCWDWFPQPATASECMRLLVPVGRVMAMHCRWIRRRGGVVEATEDLISRYNPKWAPISRMTVFPHWVGHLDEAGFTGLESFSFDTIEHYTHDRWRGRVRASGGVGASLAADVVAAFDRELELTLRRRFPEELLQVPHRIFAVVGRKGDGP